MVKNFPRQGMPVLIVLLLSALLVVLAAYAETCVQGPLNAPGDIDFMAYVPGEYAIYRENIVDAKPILDAGNAKYSLHELLKCQVSGAGHLSELTPEINYAGGMSYCRKDSQSAKYIVGVPFAEFEILWPGPYNLHVEFLGIIDKHPSITIGPKNLIAIAIAISILAQITVLSMALRKPKEKKPSVI